MMTCSKCGAALPPDAFRGLCPRCVLKAALNLGKPARRKVIAGLDPASSTGYETNIGGQNYSAADSKTHYKSELDRTPESQCDKPASPSPAGMIGERTGRLFGDYELIEEIARGGMGVVYRARQVSLNRTVAVKMILSGQYANEQFIQRFQAEAEAAAGLQHRNIVAIHEVGQHDGQHYFSMDYVEGRNLAQVSSGFGARSSEFRRTAQWMRTIAEAIDYAHRNGIIHRDLKPSNVLIDSNDEPRITDFGLAKRFGAEAGCPILDTGSEQTGSAGKASGVSDQESGFWDLTMTGQVLGSPNYLPPEQASGRRGKVDVRSDVYSLGAILYHLLTGRPPFVAETVHDTLTAVLQSEPVAPHLLNPSVPADLETICLKCLEKESVHRYPSAAGLAEELGRYLRDEPILARPVPAAEKFWRWCRRNPVVASLAAATALLLVAVAVGSPIAAFRINRERQQTALKAEEGRQRLVRLNVTSGLRVLSYGDPLSSLPWFIEALRLEEGHSVQQEVQKIRMETILQNCPRLLHCWFPEGGADTSPFRSKATARFSPDGQRVLAINSKAAAAGEREGEVIMWDVSTGKPAFAAVKHKGIVYHAEFSPDGSRFVTASGTFRNGVSVDGEARLWDAFTGAPLSPAWVHKGVAHHASFSSDGQKVVTASRCRSSRESMESDALIWDATGGALVVPPLRHEGEVLVARFSPDDRKVITSSVRWSAADGEQHYGAIWDGATGKPLTKPLLLPGRMSDFLCQSNRIYFLAVNADREPEAYLYDAETGELAMPPMRHEFGILDAVFSSDGARILTSSADYTVHRWEAFTGRFLNPPLRHNHFVRTASYSADRERIVTASFDGTARVWRKDGRIFSPPMHHGTSVLQASFSPNGRRVLTRTADQVIRIWEFGPHDAPDLELEHGGPVRHVQFSPDGRRILTAGADGAAVIWDVKSGKRVAEPMRHEGALTRAFFSRDGRLVITSSEDRTARIWDAATGRLVLPPLSHDDIVWCARFSPDGKQAVTASGQVFRTGRRIRPPLASSTRSGKSSEPDPRPAEAVVWNVATGERLFSLPHSNTVSYAEFSPDGKRIVTASADRTARVWDAATGQAINAPMEHASAVMHAAFSPDGRRVITARAGEALSASDAQIWDATTGQLIGPPLQHHDGVQYAIFSPNGRRVATASADNTARIWDASNGATSTPLLPHPRPVSHLAFSPDGKLLVTASMANHAAVWDATTGEPLRPPFFHPEAVLSVSFSPDGESVVTACRDGWARVWNLRPYRLETEDLILWAQVLSARQVDKTGTDLEPLSRSTMSNAWQTLRSKSSRLVLAPVN
jgi:WD40 repeat protein/serine/threonine protein kinase